METRVHAPSYDCIHTFILITLLVGFLVVFPSMSEQQI